MTKTNDLPAGPMPVAWMYKHIDGDYWFQEEQEANWDWYDDELAPIPTETPLSPTSLVTDLLEALRDIVENEQFHSIVRWERARAAIAKAEGRS